MACRIAAGLTLVATLMFAEYWMVSPGVALSPKIASETRGGQPPGGGWSLATPNAICLTIPECNTDNCSVNINWCNLHQDRITKPNVNKLTCYLDSEEWPVQCWTKLGTQVCSDVYYVCQKTEIAKNTFVCASVTAVGSHSSPLDCYAE